MAEVSFQTPDGVTVPAISTAEMKRVDQIAMEDIGVTLLQMMENAGRNLALHAHKLHETGSIVVIAGAGGNGGGGLACARHLTNRDIPVRVVLDHDPAKLTGAVANQLRILRATDTPIITSPKAIFDAAILIDALIGYGLTDAPRGRARELINQCNEMATPVLSLDIPSGYDATTGETPGVAVTPNRTLTLALPKQGLKTVPGDIYLGDISIPKGVYEKLNIEYTNPFSTHYWVKLRNNSRS